MSADQHKNQRIGVFVDVQNMYYSGKQHHSAKVNFKELLKEAVKGRTLIRAFAYVIKADMKDEQNFRDALSNFGYEVKIKDLQVFFGGAKKGDWDIGIAMDMIELAPKLDTLVLVSGDGDFVPLVEYLKNTHGCQVEVVSFGKSSSSKLIEIADDFLDLDENPKKYILRSRVSSNRRRLPTEIKDEIE